MYYLAYETLRRSTRPWAWMAEQGLHMVRNPGNPFRDMPPMRIAGTMLELQERALRDYDKVGYNVWEAFDDDDVVVDQEIVHSLPFGDLIRFNVETGEERPKVLIAAALSGHYATLLQGTVKTLVQDFDTHITDWKNARDVPLEDGVWGLDGYISYLIEFLEVMGNDTHVVAICQAAPPAMTAIAHIAEHRPDLMPKSLTLMGGPIDTRVAPSQMSQFATKMPPRFFEMNNIHTVPAGYPGAGRKVYPGFMQLSAFIALNPTPHLKQYASFIKNTLIGEEEAAEKYRNFYDEYFAVLDMEKEFYLETLDKIFLNYHIPRGMMEYQGQKVDFTAVKDLPLLTVEGQNDHLCPPGQTLAAHDILKGIAPELRRNHLQEGVGHYGVFSGSRFQAEIYPVICEHIWDAIGRAEPANGKLTASRKKKVPEGVLDADIPV